MTISRALKSGAALGLACAGSLACVGAVARAHLDPHAVHAGAQVYAEACLACHGPQGRGLPRAELGFTPPDTWPDFADCRGTAPEYTRDWRAVIVGGGPARGFAPIMPAFGQVLTPAQIDAVIAYLRSLCTEPDWAPGELNVPRAQVTEKAFPEDELVFSSAVDAAGRPEAGTDLIYEWQFSARNQLEIDAPLRFVRPEGAVHGGLGDISLGVKHILSFSLDPSATRGSILAVQPEIVLPTGSRRRALGSGAWRYGGFLAWDTLLPHASFLQLQAGGDASRHPAQAPATVYVRMAGGRTLYEAPGRLWTPMLELVAGRELAGGSHTDFDLVPQLQVSLNRRQHVLGNLGYRIALNDTRSRRNAVMLYVLWDWLDGRLTEGWR